MQARGVLTLPKKVRDAAGITKESFIEIESRDGEIIMRPQSKLDPELARAVREALEDLRTGNVSPAFSSGEEFEAYMKQERTKKRTKK